MWRVAFMVSQTVAAPCLFEGIGIHSGKVTRVRLLPAQSGGIRFRRMDLGGRDLVVGPDGVRVSERFTLLEQDGVDVHTPEHLMAALANFGISHVVIELDGAELPILDGSALPFIEGIEAVGLADADPVEALVIREPIVVQDGEKWVMGLPAKTSQFSYVLSYPQSFIGTQMVQTGFEEFAEEISPARTYGFEAEVKALLARGLALGGSLDNAVVIGETGYLSELRFPDELARHKLLDLVGDLWILGRPIIGHVIGFKSGHALNAGFVKRISGLYQV